MAAATTPPRSRPAREPARPAPAGGQAPPAQPPHAAPTRRPVHRGWITVAVMSATLMQVLDTTIVNVALPHMQGTMSATVDEISWVLTSYIVAAAVMTPPTGWVANRIGRKRLLLIAVAGFTLSSIGCGLSGALSEMVMFRLLQGTFGASLAPVALSTMLDTYPRERHGQAMAIYGMGLMVGPMLGPILGGWLTEQYSWRWVFFINVPVGILCVTLTLLFMHEIELDRSRRFDFFGFAALSLGVGMLQLVLDRGQELDWFSSSEIILEAALSALGFYVFVVHSFTTDQPFIDLEMFKDRNYGTGSLLMFCAGMVLLATLALMPPFMENLLGFPVLTVGLIMSPRGLATMFSMFLVGRLVNKVDPRRLIFLGVSLIATAFWIMSGFNLNVGIWDIIFPGLVQGAGMGFFMTPLITLAYSTLPARKRTEAAAIFNLQRNIGSSIGISIMFTLLTRHQQVNHATLAQNITPFNPAYLNFRLPGGLSVGTPQALAGINGMINQQAAMISFVDDFKAMMLLGLLILPLVFLLKRPPRHDQPQAHAKDAPRSEPPPAEPRQAPQPAQAEAAD